MLKNDSTFLQLLPTVGQHDRPPPPLGYIQVYSGRFGWARVDSGRLS